MDKGFTTYHSMIGGAFYKSAVDYLDIYEKHGRGDGLLEASEDVEEAKIILIVCVASYIEALVNHYLSCRLSSEHFALLDKSNVMEKWTVVPSLFIPRYSFSTVDSLYMDLDALVKRRNGIAHAKPPVIEKGKKVRRGKQPRNDIEHDQVLNWIKLPDRLIEHLRSNDKSHDFQLFDSSIWFYRRNERRNMELSSRIAKQKQVLKKR
jgi:hypothetical protein